jgi:hypothetical protein
VANLNYIVVPKIVLSGPFSIDYNISSSKHPTKTDNDTMSILAIQAISKDFPGPDNNHIFETTQAIKWEAGQGVKYTKDESCHGNIFRAVLFRVIISSQIITSSAMK